MPKYNYWQNGRSDWAMSDVSTEQRDGQTAL